MAKVRIGDVVTAVGGRLHGGDPGQEIDGAVIDSRAVRGGELFFALPGSRTDGHDFVAEALRKGAVGAVISHVPAELPESGASIVVDDVLAALQALAGAVRRRLPEHLPKQLIGITGSAGKTTTKELLAALLAARHRVAHTPGNLNNLIGFPLSLLNVPEGTEWMVAELGMSSAGELRELSLLARPDAAVFTVVRPVHLEFFASVQAIAEAKAELLAGLAPGGLIVGNADDPEVARIVRRDAPPGSRTVWYGIKASETVADVRARDLAPAPAGEVGSRFVLAAGGESVPVALPLHGLYNVENALAAAACAWALGLSLQEIAAAFETVKPASGRGVVHRLAAGVTVIDDSYNSNPDAAAKALAGAAALPAARRVAVLGEMLELGPEGPRFHREVGATAAELGFGPVIGVGELARELVAGARSGGSEALWFAESAAAAAWAADALQPGDVALVKGSRGVRLERVVQALLTAGGKV
jgi:UDP-N-acetylmuramoyl-tripeptide--D-alanyl-D-alanine ligase